jgi:hypothetical protein
MALQSVAEVSLHGSGANAFALSHPAAVDAIQVLPEDGLAERLAGALAGQDSRQTLPERIRQTNAVLDG